ncbi:GNAT family N-acetyltransferase [Acinetobacter variabilis]|uniref:GNAT family N-acetyltransferase n=1 Tax=Acinetobacter variabilis TaxID=70346 RepID=UPI003D76A838
MKKSIYQLDKIFKYEIMSNDFEALKFLRQDVEALSYLYPEIKKWYWNVFANGFLKAERKILLAKESSGQLAGFSLLKNDLFEKKICTFYILPEYRESGLGRKLLPIAISMVGEKNVGITVSESVDASLNPLLSLNGFEIERIEPDLYLPKTKEIIYKLD